MAATETKNASIDAIQFEEQASSPGVASSGHRRLWLKSDGKWYEATASVLETFPQLAVPMCAVSLSTAQTIPDSTSTPVTWDTEDIDNDDMHSSAVNADRITIKTAGVYMVNVHVSWVSNTTGNRQIVLKKNGNEVTRDSRGAVGVTGGNLSYGPAECAALDYFTVALFQSSGGPLDATTSSRFSVYRVG